MSHESTWTRSWHISENARTRFSARPGSTDPLKTSILASVYIVDELFRERARGSTRDADTEELGRAAERLIERLDRSLNSLDGDTEPSEGQAEGSP